jgi:hypothetical protein
MVDRECGLLLERGVTIIGGFGRQRNVKAVA